MDSEEKTGIPLRRKFKIIGKKENGRKGGRKLVDK